MRTRPPEKAPKGVVCEYVRRENGNRYQKERSWHVVPLKGKWYRITPNKLWEIAFLQGLAPETERCANGCGDGLLISESAYLRYLQFEEASFHPPRTPQ